MKWLSALAACLLLLACNGQAPIFTCHDPCKDKAQMRDLFCNCFDPKDYKEKAPQGPQPFVYASDCVCLQPNGEYTAWFINKPLNFDSLPGKQVPVSAYHCENLVVCPFINVPGNDKPQQIIFTGRMTLSVRVNTHVQNWVSGKEAWGLVGSDVSIAEHFPIAGPQFASLALDQAATPAPDVPHLDCNKHCADADEVCFRFVLQKYADPLARLAAHIIENRPSVIDKSSLLSRFNLTDDPCKRGPVLLANGEISNTGEVDCIVTGGSTQLQARVLFPARLGGTLTYAPSSAQAVFKDAATAPILAFSDLDIEHDFGGEVRTFTVTAKDLTAETYNGCVQALFK